MSVRSSAPAKAGSVYLALVMIGLLAAAVGAATIGVIVYNYTSREELRNPVPLHDEHHADIPTWIALG